MKSNPRRAQEHEANGAYFAGWGFMRFWEPRKMGSPRHMDTPLSGEGDDIGEISHLAPARPFTEEARHLQNIINQGQSAGALS